MPERLNTTSEAAESAVFSPVEDFYVQVSTQDPTTTFAVMGRIDTNAEWVEIGTLNMTTPIGYFAALPFVKVGVRGNINQATAKAWSSP